MDPVSQSETTGLFCGYCNTSSTMSHVKHKNCKIKIAVFGDRSVGKTAFVVRFITKRFIGEYDANRETTYNHKMLLDKEEVAIEILDTSQQPDDAIIEHIKWADGFFLIFSVTDKPSCNKAGNILALINKTVSKPENHVPVIVLANKKDLILARKVTEAEVSEMSLSLKYPVHEVSVAEDYGTVCRMFEELVRLIKKEQLRLKEASEKSVLNTVKKALKKKMYRSKSDTV